MNHNNLRAEKTNLLIDMLKIMKEKKLKLIPKETVYKELTEFERLLRDNFEKV